MGAYIKSMETPQHYLDCLMGDNSVAPNAVSFRKGNGIGEKVLCDSQR